MRQIRIMGGAALLLAGALGVMNAPSALAQATFPDRPLRMIQPFPPGGSADMVARLIAAQMGVILKTTIVLESVPGAGGTLATARVAKAPADGYTILYTTPNHTINPALYPNLPFNTERDLTPISQVAAIPELLVASAAAPFADFAGFVRYARANPGKLDYASAGNGTLPHITMEVLLQKLGLRVLHVPYKGAAPAMNDLLAGQVALKMDTIATSVQHIATGKLKPLALASLQRSALMPNVPTVAESGIPGYTGILWLGLLVPSGTNREIIDKLYRSVAESARTPAFRQRLDAEGIDTIASTPAEFEKIISTELRQWDEIIRSAKIKAD